MLVCILLFLMVAPYHGFFGRIGGARPVQMLSHPTVTVAGEKRQLTLPQNIEHLSPRTKVTVRYDLHDVKPGTVLQVRTTFAPMTMRVDGRVVYRFGYNWQRPRMMKDPGTMIRIVPLDAGRHAVVSLTYYSPVTRDTLKLAPPLMSNQSGIVRYDVNHFGLTMLLAFVLMVTGAVLIFLSIFVITMEWRGMLILWTGLFSLLTGLWGFSNCDMALFFIDDANMLYVLSYLSFFTLVIPLEFFLEGTIHFHHPTAFKWIRRATMILALLAFVLQVFGVVMFSQSTRFFQIFLPLSLITYTVGIVIEAVRYKRKDAILLAMSMLVVIGFMMAELLAYKDSIGYSRSPYFLSGVAIYCVFMCTAGAFIIRRNILIQRLQREQEQQLDLLNHELTEQRKYQQTLIDHEARLRRQRHDYRHHLTVLKAYNDDGLKKEMADYIDNLLDAVSPPGQADRFCDNITINAVIMHYVQMAREAGVEPTIRMALPKELTPTQEQELCVVFGNLLENACEAIGRINEAKTHHHHHRHEDAPAEKFIELNSVLHNDNLIIRMKNSCTGKSRRWGQFYISSKRDEVGIGLTSIADIAETEHGDATFRMEGHVFISEVYLLLT